MNQKDITQSKLTPANTTVFILAAGRGERMMPLTKNTPKPLLKVHGKSLIEHHLTRLSELGFIDVVINIAYLGDTIIQQLGNGHQFGLNIQYSDERISGALETAGGIHHALPLIKHNHFLCLNADIWTDFDFSTLLEHHQQLASIVLVKNPKHNQGGDFRINLSSNIVLPKIDSSIDEITHTFSGISLYQKKLFSHLKPGKQALGPLLNAWCEDKLVTGIIYSGEWHDIGTPLRLNELNSYTHS